MKVPANATRHSTTKSVRIERDVPTVFAFLANPANWPQWAVVNVKSTSLSSDRDWWDMMTPHGPARLRIRADAAHGILDHDWIDPQASWTVPARVVANEGGAEFMMTFRQPPSFSDAFFDEQIKLVDVELAKLKETLEAKTIHGGGSK